MSKFDPQIIIGPADQVIRNPANGKVIGYVWENLATKNMSDEEAAEYWRKRRVAENKS